MQKTLEQLQIELDREKRCTTKLNRRIDRLREQLRQVIRHGLDINGYQQNIDFICGIIRQELMEIYYTEDIRAVVPGTERQQRAFGADLAKKRQGLCRQIL